MVIVHKAQITRFLLLLSLFLLAAALSGCQKRASVEFTPLPTQFVSATFVVPALESPSPSPTPSPIKPQALTSYRLSIHNLYPWDAFVFLNGQFLMKVRSQRAGTYMDMPSGSHTLQFCQDPRGTICEPPIYLDVDQDLIVTSPGGLNAMSPPLDATPVPPTTEAPFLLPAQIVTPTFGLPPLFTEVPSTPSGGWTPWPTVPVEKMSFMLTVHNRYPWPLRVEIDNRYLMTVPPRKYLWHLGIPGGHHTLKFCWGESWCLQREIYLDHDMEIIVSP